MDRIDGYLSNKAQSVWPDSLVLCVDDRHWIIRRPGVPDVGLGDNFQAASQAAGAMLRAQRAKGEKS